jgi:hypothetical protein
MNEVPARLRERPWTLIRRTVGDREAIRGKLERASHALVNYLNRRRVEDRLRTLLELGLIERIPNRTQLLFGSLDMFRFFIVPCAADYYRSKDIRFGFHALLRVLDDPASMMDPTGLVSHPDAIIGHLLQVTHADPVYDIQLLAAHRGGIDELEHQLEMVLAGTHPRAASIGAIVEDPTYHARLLEYVREFRIDPHCSRLLRENIERNPEFKVLADTFGSLPTALEYFASLPPRPLRALIRLLRTHEFPGQEAAAREIAAANDSDSGEPGRHAA